MALYDVSLTGGVDGKSAYQYAVEAGYEGTEEEFAQLLNEIDNLSSDASRITYNDTTVKTELDNINTELDNVLPSANTYTDTKVANLVGSAPETLNTLEKVAQAIKDNEDVVEALNSVIGNKANQSDLETLQGTVTTNGTALNTHTSNTSNPHNVTKTQVGLSEVDNTSDANKPVSTPQQTAIDKSLSESKDYTDTKVANLVGSAPETLNTLEEVAQAIKENEDVVSALNNAIGTKANQSDLTSHTGNTSNPHAVTKTQVGLGNVDNTSDANKPVSTATQVALDLKANQSDLTTHTSNKSNPHAVTKSQVGLGNVDNTSDANKPISTAVQAALDLKANQTDLNSVITTISSFSIASEEAIDNIVNSLN